MSKNLPEPIAAYFAAKNRHDIDGMLVPFAEDAIVKDEGKEHRGSPAIRSWMDETTRKYRVTVDVVDVTAASDRTFVVGKVSGNFPGSPANLRYAFTLADTRIAALEIA